MSDELRKAARELLNRIYRDSTADCESLWREAEDLEAMLAAAPTPPAQGASSGPAYGIFDPDYARVFTQARCIAWAEGYALAVHGSFTRDLDLLAVPWTDAACDADHLVRRIVDATGLRDIGRPPSDKPHGRRAWTLRFPTFGDPRFIDLSVMPPKPAQEDA